MSASPGPKAHNGPKAKMTDVPSLLWPQLEEKMPTYVSSDLFNGINFSQDTTATTAQLPLPLLGLDYLTYLTSYSIYDSYYQGDLSGALESVSDTNITQQQYRNALKNGYESTGKLGKMIIAHPIIMKQMTYLTPKSSKTNLIPQINSQSVQADTSSNKAANVVNHSRDNDNDTEDNVDAADDDDHDDETFYWSFTVSDPKVLAAGFMPGVNILALSVDIEEYQLDSGYSNNIIQIINSAQGLNKIVASQSIYEAVLAQETILSVMKSTSTMKEVSHNNTKTIDGTALRLTVVESSIQDRTVIAEGPKCKHDQLGFLYESPSHHIILLEHRLLGIIRRRVFYLHTALFTLGHWITKNKISGGPWISDELCNVLKHRDNNNTTHDNTINMIFEHISSSIIAPQPFYDYIDNHIFPTLMMQSKQNTSKLSSKTIKTVGDNKSHQIPKRVQTAYYILASMSLTSHYSILASIYLIRPLHHLYTWVSSHINQHLSALLSSDSIIRSKLYTLWRPSLEKQHSNRNTPIFMMPIANRLNTTQRVVFDAIVMNRKMPNSSSSSSSSSSMHSGTGPSLSIPLSSSSPVWVIHGPPGTGKSELVNAIAGHLVQQKQRILLTAHSNAAIDQLIHRFNQEFRLNNTLIVQQMQSSMLKKKQTPVQVNQVQQPRQVPQRPLQGGNSQTTSHNQRKKEVASPPSPPSLTKSSKPKGDTASQSLSPVPPVSAWSVPLVLSPPVTSAQSSSLSSPTSLPSSHPSSFQQSSSSQSSSASSQSFSQQVSVESIRNVEDMEYLPIIRFGSVPTTSEMFTFSPKWYTEEMETNFKGFTYKYISTFLPDTTPIPLTARNYIVVLRYIFMRLPRHIKISHFALFSFIIFILPCTDIYKNRWDDLTDHDKDILKSYLYNGDTIKTATKKRSNPPLQDNTEQKSQLSLNEDLFNTFKRQLHRFEEQCWVRYSPVVCGTLYSVGSYLSAHQYENPSSYAYPKRLFDTVIIDEAGQASEVSIMGALSIAKTVVLAGDHFQLPPVAAHRRSVYDGFNISLMERIYRNNYGVKNVKFSAYLPPQSLLLPRHFEPGVSSNDDGNLPLQHMPCLSYIPLITLEEQYRMNSILSDWIKRSTYWMILYRPGLPNVALNTLIASKLHSNIGIQYNNNSSISQSSQFNSKSGGTNNNSIKPLFCDDIYKPIVWIDTNDLVSASRFKSHDLYDSGHNLSHIMRQKPGSDFFDKSISSYFNMYEAWLCLTHALRLIHSNIDPSRISIIAPYRAGVGTIQQLFTNVGLDMINISTVDSLQGNESDIIIYSIVRSNSDNQLGFVTDIRRLNVAMSRAKQQLCIIGNSTTASMSSYLRNLYTYKDTTVIDSIDYIYKLTPFQSILPSSSSLLSSRKNNVQVCHNTLLHSIPSIQSTYIPIKHTIDTYDIASKIVGHIVTFLQKYGL